MALPSPKDLELGSAAGHEKRVRFAPSVEYYCRNPFPYLSPVRVPVTGHPVRSGIVNIRRPNSKFQSCLLTTSLVFAIVAFACLLPIIIFYLLGPCPPAFHVQQVDLHYPIFYTGPTTSLQLNVTMKMKVHNPSWSFNIFYESDNSVVANYSGILQLCNGTIPPFHLSPMKEKLVEANLTSFGIDVAAEDMIRMNNHHEKKRVPLALSFDMRSMVRFKIGSHTIMSAVVKSYCDLDLENLDNFYHPPRIISQVCDSEAGFWFPVVRST
ncbi:hypothetical protein COLO4_31846 [Corchorus olitorius]|uniref:Late embryogenesis abundant protein, LEA-14 n=1 Tax=Corchorus olitorius TaxID=93759 RepID=A0A1R3H329_9ROSI|nr:hypothetical protein COLO4_31846 [Corchorus olitorius]